MTDRVRDYALGAAGIVLIALVARLARPAYLSNKNRQPVRRALARRAIDGMVGIARLVDRASGEAAPSAGDTTVAANRPALAR